MEKTEQYKRSKLIEDATGKLIKMFNDAGCPLTKKQIGHLYLYIQEQTLPKEATTIIGDLITKE